MLQQDPYFFIKDVVSYQNMLITKKTLTIPIKDTNIYIHLGPLWLRPGKFFNISHVLSTRNIYVFVTKNTNIYNIKYIPY
jgi:hypothetical protein